VISTFGSGDVHEYSKNHFTNRLKRGLHAPREAAATLVLFAATIDRDPVLHLRVWVVEETQRKNMTSLIKRSAIPLDHAVLCLDCNCVSDANRECPACSSRALMNLSVVLDRREEFSESRELAAA
jgi:hypothetical protein